MPILPPDDPAQDLLQEGIRDPSKRSIVRVYVPTCYICRDPEYALMGLPLCYPCFKCGGHVPADDCICDACETDQQDDPSIPKETAP